MVPFLFDFIYTALNLLNFDTFYLDLSAHTHITKRKNAFARAPSTGHEHKTKYAQTLETKDFAKRNAFAYNLMDAHRI